MRITNKMLSNNFLRDMKTNLNNLSTIQTQMATGKQIRKASDDPSKASKIMQIYSDIDANKQYNDNISNTSNWLDVTDTALDHVGKVATRIQELLVSVGNAGYGDNQRTAVKDEINQRVSELSEILNTSFDGKYIFGGTRGTDKPTAAAVVTGATGTTNKDNTTLSLTADSATVTDVANSKAKLSVEISQGVTMDYNVTASDVVDFGGEKSLTSLLANITGNLDAGKNVADTTAAVNELTTTDLKGIQNFMTNVLKLRSQVGAKQNRMDSALARNVDQNTNMTEILSTTEDIDITEKSMEYATMQTVYTAALQTSAKVLQPSLLDYL
ncbi:flagellar hook-associated protein 3 [Clostridium estertheticum]|uniref:Flagellar hook-associated protein 3 n=2 Tax=Clostridium estertheticum TaxID=238834 RepID=A0A1J0GIG6_9CLOT|nr:flagellar hook-associated protein FlgL [Clostridium estertheticum]APC41178.1 flagellar hook-associated protein 3 [Clostridium estertheticum subsp. estertheticum]MBU3074190.1 flagellar hook-associated protein FlgL [Clostridium estertheticum]MBU3164284.1 flagellar hook-associated protein FlgL [Clostridium estertheticum]MPQ32567.1 flagellar hook-associated protein 3 [Clostridium estertheticum]MPQ63226.1 flagellar hook-associated protein 3 [Clostridium estertheticum]